MSMINNKWFLICNRWVFEYLFCQLSSLLNNKAFVLISLSVEGIGADVELNIDNVNKH